MPQPYSKEQQTKAKATKPNGATGATAAKTATKKATPGKAAAEAAKGATPKPTETSGGKKGGNAAYVVRAIPKGFEYPAGGFATFDELSGKQVSKVFATKDDALADATARNGFSTSAAKRAKLSSAEPAAASVQEAPPADPVSAPQTAKPAAKAGKVSQKPAAGKAAKVAPPSAKSAGSKTTPRSARSEPAAKVTNAAKGAASKRTRAADRQIDPRLAGGPRGASTTSVAKGLRVKVTGGAKVGSVGTIRTYKGSTGSGPIWTVETGDGLINVMAHHLKVTGKAAAPAA